MCGIYVPFWIYDIDYSSSVILSGKFDASKELEDRYSERLEPFDCSEMTDFDISYLTGFYADCYDADSDTSEYSVVNKVKDIYNKKVKKSVHTAFRIKIESDISTCKINSAYYSLLPVWFLSFVDDDNTYTMMINGQTGKVVGAVPYDKSNFIKSVFISGICMSIPLIFIINLLTNFSYLF